MKQNIIDELIKDGFEVEKETDAVVIMARKLKRNKVDLVQIKNGEITGELNGITEVEAKAIIGA